MDKCVCVMHLFYMRVHAWFDATRVFTFVHVCDMRVLFKFWVICTVLCIVCRLYLGNDSGGAK